MGLSGNQYPGTGIIMGGESRLLFAKIAMAIWFQVSGIRRHEALMERFISYAIHGHFLD
jgi:hypothetical protein